MANYEIDSFVRKFNVLCQAGRSASLTLSSDAGKASLNLSVDLGVLPEEGVHHPHHPKKHSIFGPETSPKEKNEQQLIELKLKQL